LIQLEEQLALGPDYVALGPLYPTTSKRNAEPVLGAAALHLAVQSTRRAGIALVAIGGINEETLVDAARSAEMVALISLAFPPPGTHRPYSWMEKRCRVLNELVLAQPLGDPSESRSRSGDH
jgi:thiamine-phosphate pyrophosphorylase